MVTIQIALIVPGRRFYKFIEGGERHPSGQVIREVIEVSQNGGYDTVTYKIIEHPFEIKKGDTATVKVSSMLRWAEKTRMRPQKKSA